MEASHGISDLLCTTTKASADIAARSDSKLATSEHEAAGQVELAVDTSDLTGTVKLSETEAEKQFGKESPTSGPHSFGF